MSKTEHWLIPDWPAPDNIHAATTLRTGGVSVGAFESFNPAMHVGDNLDRVIENRRMIKQRLGLPSEPVWLEQIHSNLVVDAAKSGSVQQADASYSAEPGIVCTVMTADCLPLLVCDIDGTCVAAIHAGWRGLLAGIITNMVNTLRKHNLLIWLGPAIGPECFEVGAEVRDAFVDKSTIHTNAFKEMDEGKWLADIYQLARNELMIKGLDKIYGGNFCTFTEQSRFYSYRRDKETGRMATLIWRD
jgi:polyphenol oxidase